MKKSFISALTTALVVGAASTTFAAANPFSDVPADHWAYDAVSQLAVDGVIEGYGDTTFQGNKNITRYEMAQMIARAMAKQDVSAADKAMIDKLAAEFADELDHLGVRVANLEKNADHVKWTGMGRYTYASDRKDGASRANKDEFLLRLEPKAAVNDNWTVNARLEASVDLSDDTNASDVTLKRVWAQGDYKNFSLKFGKFASKVNNTLIFDNPFSGVGVTFGNKLKANVEAGRIGADEIKSDYKAFGKAASYQGLGLSTQVGSLGLNAGYYHADWNVKSADDDDANIWFLGGNYAFDKSTSLGLQYAKADNDENASKKAQDKAYEAVLNYKGAQKANQGSWGAWAAYRYLGDTAVLKPTYDAISHGYRGWEVGMNYTVFKNILATLRYGDNKQLRDDATKDKILFGRVEFFF